MGCLKLLDEMLESLFKKKTDFGSLITEWISSKLNEVFIPGTITSRY
jgi:hypothetical protein